MTTRELFWKRALDTFRPVDAVAWALKQLETVPGTPALATLAGLPAPHNAFEVEDLLRDAFSELDLREPSAADSYRDFVCSHVSDVLTGKLQEPEACRRFADAYRADMDRSELQAFWLLDWAVRDHEAQGSQHYDARFTGSNLRELVRFEAEKLAAGFCRELEAAPSMNGLNQAGGGEERARATRGRRG